MEWLKDNIFGLIGTIFGLFGLIKGSIELKKLKGKDKIQQHQIDALEKISLEIKNGNQIELNKYINECRPELKVYGYKKEIKNGEIIIHFNLQLDRFTEEKRNRAIIKKVEIDKKNINNCHIPIQIGLELLADKTFYSFISFAEKHIDTIEKKPEKLRFEFTDSYKSYLYFQEFLISINGIKSEGSKFFEVFKQE